MPELLLQKKFSVLELWQYAVTLAAYIEISVPKLIYMDYMKLSYRDFLGLVGSAMRAPIVLNLLKT